MSMSNDYLKHNEAIRLGWSILYFMSNNLHEKTIDKTIEYVKETIDIRQGTPYRPTRVQPPVSTQELFRRLRERNE